MEDLLKNQSLIIDAMNTLFTNFKKDGSDRKTACYVKKRLSTLEGYWQEFQSNHIKLCEYDDHSHDYFTSNTYKRTSEFYIDIRAHIQNYLPSDTSSEEKQLLRPATPLAQGGRPATSRIEPPAVSQQPCPMDSKSSHSSAVQGMSSKLEEMLRKQNSNFKAFARTVSNINLDNISDRWEFEDILKTVQTRWSAIDSLHWEIDSELYENTEYEQTFGKYEQQFNDIKKNINSKMWSQSHREKSTPQMDIPAFLGNYHQWVSFKDLFVEAIHNNRSLSNAQKLQFLKSKLRGEAEKLVQHLPITSENYEVSWNILNHRYNNVKLIFNSHVNILFNLPSMQQQSATAIKKIFDTTNECLNAIKALGVDISTWDPLIVYLLSNKLDADTHIDYIESLKNPRILPSLVDLLQFLENKFTSLEASRRKPESSKPQNHQDLGNNFKKPQYFKSLTSHQNHHQNQVSQKSSNRLTQKAKCAICNKDRDHAIYNCEAFLNMLPQMRQNIVTKLSLCTNCLHFHRHGKCFTSKKCRECDGDHNTLLHGCANKVVSKTRASEQQDDAYKQAGQLNSNVLQEQDCEILLATALVKVTKVDGSVQTMRVLVDQGSQVSLIAESAAQRLGIKRKGCKAVVSGVGSKENKCHGMMSIVMSSLHNDYTLDVNVFVTKKLVNNLPNKSFLKPTWSHIESIQLADPYFFKSSSIDILLGADVYSAIILSGIIKDNDTMPIAQQTRLGWILCGSASVTKSYHCNVTLIDDDLHQFWQIEDVAENQEMSSEDLHCMQLYQSTTERHTNGRYIVRLPLHVNIDEKLGHSKPKALAQFYQLERKFKRQQQLAADYKLFMQEYRSLGHMQLDTSAIAAGNKKPIGYYMPHHSVLRAESTTTKLRVVYNASERTSTGHSLNDLMFRGPNLQNDLLVLILRFRQYPFAFTADCEKMYRQILVHYEDQKYQKIVWRDSPEEPVRDYQLSSVTYGTKSAPFLAIMTLRKLAQDERHTYPAAAKVLEEQIYMDDILTGQFSVESAKRLKVELIKLLGSAGFNLRKWASNELTILDENMLPEPESPTFNFRHQESTKTLGLAWNSKEDNFTFQCKMAPKSSQKPTKRLLLSEISKIFDPLGWLSPVVVQLKLLFQSIWTLDLQWDEEIPDEHFKRWVKLREDIEYINTITVPRWIQSGESDVLQLHGFCDASTKAYAGVVYVRVQKQNGTTVTLLASKTKVVPLNKTTSLPRLELSGAVLLAKLMTKIVESLKDHKIEIYGWCDSTAVLGWLQGDPGRWKPFVANRVKKTIEVIPSNSWRYIKSEENPADCASRGLYVKQLKDHLLWWNGPHWLPTTNPLSQNNKFETNLETKLQTNAIQINNTEIDIIAQLLRKHSSITRVARVLAWVMRAIKQKSLRQAFLTADEIIAAKLKIIKYVQMSEFSVDILNIQKDGKVKQNSKICNLNPYLDKNGALRVGGRLENSNISEDMKHPLIIPHSSHLTDLIIDHAHKASFHGGARLTLSYLRREYWILGGNRAVKKRLHQCVICKRHAPNKQYQIMGDLPEARTNPSRPYYKTGVDYTGFVDVKASKGRGIKTTKGYVAVFVCMATKAVHLELASDLTSSAFLAALRRFAARRGTPRHIYSDNGTNFVGANKVLNNEFSTLKSILSGECLAEISDMRINWHFNAPSWPSAGGLWEAAVKSLKYHLRRVVGEQKLTFEEYTTLLAQLEACLNSRPLCAISEDPNDINYLTPSHFLASGPLLTIYETEKDERTRWKLTQKIFDDIWARWRVEYLTQLTARSKWQQGQNNVKLNDIVVIHDANLPPGKWALGRVVDVHPGKDGHVRVISIKTKNGVLKRPIVKVSLLPVNSSDKNQIEVEQQQTTATQQKPAPSKPAKKNNFVTSCINFIMTLFMLFALCGTASAQSNYDIKTLHSNNSIYFDKLSDLRIIQDKWKLIVYYNMDPYWSGARLLQQYYKNLNSLCEKFVRKSHCDTITLQLRHSFAELEYYNTMLQNQRFEQPTRMKRGLINGVGNIANGLFGLLDDNFAKKYEKDITKIRIDQKYLVNLWKNQTSIIEAENNILKRIGGTMENQHKIFQNHLNALEQATISLKSEIEQIDISEEFILASIIANNIVNNLKSIQDTLLDTMINTHHFNFHILSPEQLRSELNIISGQLSKDAALPIENIQTDLPKVYEILKVSARMTRQYFIFEILIPLVNRDTYELYKTYSVPQQHNNSTVFISPIADYVAINLQKDTYLPISETELRKCIQLDKTSTLCELQKPVFHRDSDEDLCIRNQQNRACITYTSTCHDTWTELINVNKFLVTCCDKCNLRFICGRQVTTEQLKGANIIALGSDCIIKSDSFSIMAHKQNTNEINLEPGIVLAEIATVNQIINLTIPVTSMNYTDMRQSFEAVDKKISEMRSEEGRLDREDELSSHDVHQYAAIYTVAGIVVACAVFVWWRLHRTASTTTGELRAYAAPSSPPAPAGPAAAAVSIQLAPPPASPAPARPPPASRMRERALSEISECRQCEVRVSENHGYSIPNVSAKYGGHDTKRNNKVTAPEFSKISFIRD